MLVLMKQSILIISIIFSFSSYSKNPKSYFSIQNRVKKINQKELEALIRKFIKESRPSRLVGTEGHKKALKFITTYLTKEASNESTFFSKHIFRPKVAKAEEMYTADFNKQVAFKYKSSHPIYKQWSSFTNNMIAFIKARAVHSGQNIIWTKRGEDLSAGTIYIGAHYDTMANDPNTKNLTPNERQPGADDNASGTVVALLLAKYLKDLKFKQTIKIVFFDWEELGFLGSEAFVREKLDEIKENFLGYINLEMIGYDSKITDKEKRKGNMRIYIRKNKIPGADRDRLLADELSLSGNKMTPGIKFEIVANSFNASDHLYFWKNGLHAITFSQNWESDFNPNYHTSSDIPETLNMHTLYNSYRYIASSLTAKLLEIKR